MSEASKNARAAMRAKAKRLSSSSGPEKVDASSWTPSAPMKANKKTGMRPVSPRTYKYGGKIQGDRGPKRSDKTPRGNLANEISTRDTKQANRDKFGSPHIGGMKKGGKAKRADGGRADDKIEQREMKQAAPTPKTMFERMVELNNMNRSDRAATINKSASDYGKLRREGRAKGGATRKASGGEVDSWSDRRAIPGDAPTRGPDPKGGGRATGPKYDSIDALIKDKGLKKGGKAHSDAAQDRAMIKKMVRPAAIKRDAKCGGGRMANGGKADDSKGFDFDGFMKRNNRPSAKAKKFSSDVYAPGTLKSRQKSYDESKSRKADATGDFEVERTERLAPKASDARQWRKEVASDKKNGGRAKHADGGSVAGGERPTGDRIPRARGGSTYADKDDAPRLRLMKTHTDGNKTAKVYKDADWGEYRVKHYVDGKHQTNADYHTDDVSDANSTAGSFLRSQRASGGRTKGKTNINIIVNPSKAGDDQQMQPSGPIRPPPPPVMTPPAPPPGGPPPGMPPNMPPPSMMAGPPPGMPPGMPPMRARGGRLGMNKIGGAGGGLGRLEKANMR